MVSEGNCTLLASLFPPIGNKTVVGPFTPSKANYTCINFTVSEPSSHKHDAGEIPADWCVEIFPASQGERLKGEGHMGMIWFVLLLWGISFVCENSKGNIWLVHLSAVGSPVNTGG